MSLYSHQKISRILT